MLRKLITLGCTLPLIACSTIPSGPRALVLPAAHKNATQIRTDDAACREFAHAQLVATPHPPQSLEEGQLNFGLESQNQPNRAEKKSFDSRSDGNLA